MPRLRFVFFNRNLVIHCCSISKFLWMLNTSSLASRRFLHGAPEVFVCLQTSQFGSLGKCLKHLVAAGWLACFVVAWTSLRYKEDRLTLLPHIIKMFSLLAQLQVCQVDSPERPSLRGRKKRFWNLDAWEMQSVARGLACVLLSWDIGLKNLMRPVSRFAGIWNLQSVARRLAWVIGYTGFF